MNDFHVISHSKALLKILFSYKEKKIGFIPTMGALHKGHIFLLKKCQNACDVVVISIFVNNRQFNKKKDFLSYPRNLNGDIALIKKYISKPCIVFAPNQKEVFQHPLNYKMDFGTMDKILEGLYRPGHFKGVCDVLSILFQIIQPDYVYMGKKDYQQTLIVKKLIHDNNWNIVLEACQTYRHKDGLAYSSRNQMLNKTARSIAYNLYQSLEYVKQAYCQQEKKELIMELKKQFFSHPLCKLEYFFIGDKFTLIENDNNENLIALVAAYVDEIRLIDNLEL